MELSDAQKQMDEAVAKRTAEKWAYDAERAGIEAECGIDIAKLETAETKKLEILKDKRDATLKIANAAVAKAGRVVQSASLAASKAAATKAADEAAAEATRAEAQAKAELDDEAAQAKAEVAQNGSL